MLKSVLFFPSFSNTELDHVTKLLPLHLTIYHLGADLSGVWDRGGVSKGKSKGSLSDHVEHSTPLNTEEWGRKPQKPRCVS